MSIPNDIILNVLMQCLIELSAVMLNVAFNVMLSAITLNVAMHCPIMLSVVMLNVMLSVAFFYFYAYCCYANYRYAIVLNVIMLGVTFLLIC